jgi:hypothetical protein
MYPKIEIINNWNLKKVFYELEAGNIKIPRFQRSYVWERSKAVKLLNSINAQYPIGSIFLWIAPKQFRDFIKESEDFNIPANPNAELFQFILDGQQRISSLYATLRGKVIDFVDYKTIHYHLEKKKFVIPRSNKDTNVVPAWKLLDEKEFIAVYSELSAGDKIHDTHYAEAWRNCQENFNNYPISIVRTFNSNVDEVVEIFELINQGGRRLSLYDLVHASVWSKEFDLSQRITDFCLENNLMRMGGVNNKVFIQSLALNAFDDCKNIDQLKLSADICISLWEKTAQAIMSAIGFLKDMGIHSSITSYYTQISILQYYFCKTSLSSVKDKHKKTLEDWFWKTKHSKRYSSASAKKIKEDAVWIYKLSGK